VTEFRKENGAFAYCRGKNMNLEVRFLGKRRTPHTKEAHERYLMSKSSISRLAGREKMAQQLL
jgi:hypothetical protein